jgi:hypothetical protein
VFDLGQPYPPNIENIKFLSTSFYDLAKSRQADGFVKGSRCKARKRSLQGQFMNCPCGCGAATKLKRRRGTFYETVIFDVPIKADKVIVN